MCHLSIRSSSYREERTDQGGGQIRREDRSGVGTDQERGQIRIEDRSGERTDQERGQIRREDRSGVGSGDRSGEQSSPSMLASWQYLCQESGRQSTRVPRSKATLAPVGAKNSQ